jgi:peptide deformylase
MALRNIVYEGDELLRKKSKEVKEINERIKALLDDMWETMEAAQGLGLAAPQVGVLRRLAVIDVTEADEQGNPILPLQKYELINPVLLEKEGEAEDCEGCLSVPGYIGIVKRPARIKIKALNRQGEEFLLEGEGMLAKAISHEMDHLDGILFTDIAVSVESVE